MKNPILISTAAYDGYDLSIVFKEISKIGVDLVEIAFIEGYTDPFTEDSFNEDNARLIVSLLAEYNLKCLSFSSHIDLSPEKAVGIFKRRMDFAKRVGAKYIISNAGPLDNKRQFMKNITELGQKASAMDLIIALENPGDGKKNIIDNGVMAAEVISEIGLESVQLNYDFGNLLSHCFEKIRPEEDYKHALEYSAHLHIKDVASDAEGWHFTEIGQGTINYKRILKEISDFPEPVPLSLEIPLRVTRAPDASPRRATSPIDLTEIRRVMIGSVKYVKEMLSS